MITQFLKACRSEFVRLWNNKRDFVVLLGAPVLYLVLFGFLYSYNVVNHVDTVVWDQDHTSLSRMMTDNFRSSDRFNIIGDISSQDQLKAYLDSGKAKVAIVIPDNFMRDVKKQRTSQVLVCVDGTNMVISNGVISSALEIVQTVSAGVGIKMLEGGGTLPGKAQNTLLPVGFRTRIWYNPTFAYSDFLLLGLLGTVIQQILLLFTSIAIVRDKNEGIIPQTGFAGLTGYIFGKSTPYILLNYLNMNLVLAILVFGFGVKFNGSIPLALLLEGVFILALVSLGVFLSIISKNELEATQVSMLIAVPSFLMSGYTWPLQATPAGIKAIANLLPLTHFVSVFRDIALKGINLQFVLPEIGYLAGLTFLLFPLSVLALKRHIRHKRIVSEGYHISV